MQTLQVLSSPGAVQQILPKGLNQRFEGVAFSRDGGILASATADTNAVLLFARKPDGTFEDDPYATIGQLKYPHDVALGSWGDKLLLAVAERGGAISVYEQNPDQTFGPAATCVISGPDARLSHTDGVAFVPPHDDCLVACNLETQAITFYRQTSVDPLQFSPIPDLELTHVSMDNPDGLAFSHDGRWLAVANHGSHSISIFERGATGTLDYSAPPVMVIEDPDLRHTHSVAFTNNGHLLATSAGANYFCIYRIRVLQHRLEWHRVDRQIVADENVFREVNTLNKMEGGPKGIAISDDTIAVCSPEIGIKLYGFLEQAGRSAYMAHYRRREQEFEELASGLREGDGRNALLNIMAMYRDLAKAPER